MNKKALYALLLAALVPMLCYLIVKSYSDTAIVMPRHYLADSIIAKTEKGKKVFDTAWHRLPDFSLTNQQGDTVSWAGLRGKVIVADFFFTHCPTICPGLTRNMQALQQSINNSQRVGDKTPDFLHFLSFSIDPERDSVAALKKWADRFQVDPDNWWLLTGDKKTIYDLSLKYMNLTLLDPAIDSLFPHSDIFFLIDKHGVIRARRDKDGNRLLYHSRDQQSMTNLAEDIVLLSLEKNPKKKSIFAGKLRMLAIIFLVVIAGVGVFLFAFKKKDKHAGPVLEKK